MQNKPELNVEKSIVDYELIPEQLTDLKIDAINQEYADRIAALKKERRLKVKALRNNLKHKQKKNDETLSSFQKKELKEKEREARLAEYMNRKQRYTVGEEVFSSVSHGVGAGLAVAATVLLVLKALWSAPEAYKPYYVTAFSVFGGSMVLFYLMSTLYHALTPLAAKKVFGIVDHNSLFILIAGTYTPFCLGMIHSPAGWVLFSVIWVLCILGVIFYSVFGSKMRLVSVLLYIAFIVLMLLIIRPVSSTLPKISTVFLILGCVVYLVGICFYGMKNVKWMHSIWHLLAVFGSILHFFAVMYSI